MNYMETEPITRVNVPELDAILGQKFPVLDKGFIRVVDYMGGDSSIVQAARISYGAGTKTVNEDRGLIRYLMRHRHCYHPSMQVLTADGWKRWDECSYSETFLVPDPEHRALRAETLAVEVFDADEDMQTFKSERMSYIVTADHRMWFKKKHDDKFAVVRASDIPRWGHFDPMAGYALLDDKKADPLGRLIGFALGDGSWSGNGITFHLRKARKKAYLRQTLADLQVHATESQSATYKDATIFYLGAEVVRRLGIPEYMEIGSRAADKRLKIMPQDAGIAYGIFDGLKNSDGHENEDRNDRIEFSSASPELSRSFETLASMFGFDAHSILGSRMHRVTAYPPGRTSLEARKQYFGSAHYEGKVYCATTSTGLLMVRGAHDEFAFVCGNTTPFEMCELKLHIKMPMDAWRQQIRHRMASVNEYSTRYSTAIDERQETLPGEWRLQSGTNKQGSGDFLDADPMGDQLSKEEREFQQIAQHHYERRLAAGVAREQARKDLPLSTYTEAYWKIDLHNLLHYLSLRMDSHAQKEIRDYATIIGETIVARWVPLVWEAFKDYRLDAMSLSGQEQAVLFDVIKALRAERMNAAEMAHRVLLLHDLAKPKDGVVTPTREGKELMAKLEKLFGPV